MKKGLLSLMVILGVIGVINADFISYPWNPSTSDTLTTTRYKADRNAIKSVVNGNIDNNNIKAGAAIEQSKIDSSTGWIAALNDSAGLFDTITAKTNKGLKLQNADSTKFIIIDSVQGVGINMRATVNGMEVKGNFRVRPSDTTEAGKITLTDGALGAGELQVYDSAVIKKITLSAGTNSYFLNNTSFGSDTMTTVNHKVSIIGGLVVDSMTATGKITADSIVVKGERVTSSVRVTDSVVTKGLRATATITALKLSADSLAINKRATVTGMLRADSIRIGYPTYIATSTQDTAKLQIVQGGNKVALELVDTTAYAAGVGPDLKFTAKYNSTGDYATLAVIEAEKLNATNGNYSSTLDFYTRVNGSAPVDNFHILDSGRVKAPTLYTYSVGGTNTALYVDNTGYLGKVASSRRYKTNFMPFSSAFIYDLKPTMFDYIDSTRGIGMLGLIAEEVDSVNPYPNSNIVYKTREGAVEGVNYERLITPMVQEMQNQKKTIDSLRTRVISLENNVTIIFSVLDSMRANP